MTYDGSLPPADGREYYWSNNTDNWQPASTEADHSNCTQPHRTADGYTDCDGQPL